MARLGCGLRQSRQVPGYDEVVQFSTRAPTQKFAMCATASVL